MADDLNKQVNEPDDHGTAAETEQSHDEPNPLVDEYGRSLARAYSARAQAAGRV